MRPWLTTLPLLLIAAMLVVVGAVKVGESSAGQTLLGAGLVLLGAWAGSELVRVPPARRARAGAEKDVTVCTRDDLPD